MPRTNDDVERMLLEYADLLSIVSDDPFKPRSYEKAARAVGGYPDDLGGLDAAGVLAIPSVGKSIAAKITEYLDTGTFAELEELRAQVPAGVREMTAIPGFGPKKAMVVYQELAIDSVPALVAAAEAGELRSLKGFSAKTEQNVLQGAKRMSSSGGRVLVSAALEIAEDLLERLQTIDGVRRVAYAGSLRRMAETIGDVDLLVASTDHEPVMEAFAGYDVVDRVIARGDTKTSILTRNGLQVDLRVVPLEAWGAAMIYFTGSKAHNIRIREMAVRKGLKLNEYGLFEAASGDLLAAETEAEVYEALGLPYIEPTLREDRGEVEAALAGELPDLITVQQIRGDLHTHTNLTDGLATLERMLEAAAEHRYAYYAVTDHAPDLAMQRMTDEKILAQRVQVARLQSSYPKMRLLHGTELNIGPDGSVDWDEEFLSGFDLTVASVHSHFNQSRDEMTRSRGPGDREPVRQHHRPPHDPQDRPARPGRPRSGGGVRSRRPHRHGAGDQRLPRPARSARRARVVGPPARREVRDRHRLARRRSSRRDAVRRGDRPTGMALEGRCDQRVADQASSSGSCAKGEPRRPPAEPATAATVVLRPFLGGGGARPAGPNARPGPARRFPARRTHRRGRGLRAR